MKRSVEEWANLAERARGDHAALKLLVADAEADGTPEAKSAAFRAKRYLLLPHAGRSGLASVTPSNLERLIDRFGERQITPELAESTISGLEEGTEFQIDLQATPTLLRYAHERGSVTAVEILTTLLNSDSYSAGNLLRRISTNEVFNLPKSVGDWLWAYVVSNKDGVGADILRGHKIVFPRRLLDDEEKIEKSNNPSAHHGWVYILREDGTEPCTLKIGMTTKPLSHRVSELNSSTSQHRKLVLVAEWSVDDPRAAEQRAHHALASYRIRSGREFFQIDSATAIRVIDQAIGCR